MVLFSPRCFRLLGHEHGPVVGHIVGNDSDAYDVSDGYEEQKDAGGDQQFVVPDENPGQVHEQVENVDRGVKGRHDRRVQVQLATLGAPQENCGNIWNNSGRINT